MKERDANIGDCDKFTWGYDDGALVYVDEGRLESRRMAVGFGVTIRCLTPQYTFCRCR